MNSQDTHQSANESYEAVVQVANCQLLSVSVDQSGDAAGLFHCKLQVRDKVGKVVEFAASAGGRDASIEAAVSCICNGDINFKSISLRQNEAREYQAEVFLEGKDRGDCFALGRHVSADPATAVAVAAVRAASYAGLLKSSFRANNQLALRTWADELVQELTRILGSETQTAECFASESEEKTLLMRRVDARGIALEYFNRVASAAVVTAANTTKPNSILTLFDTSAWLFDNEGRRLDSYTDTGLWLAWYPGINNGDLTVEEVIASMPAAPEVAIPWIVKMFENPSSWLRFRGAVDLEDHDVLHVLLGRGLQDQDEAFVLGFAMGTAKRVTRLELRMFKWILANVYPEPYRIPRYLHAAFDLGVACGKATGNRYLYKQSLKGLRNLPLNEAREASGIDMDIVREYFQKEQLAIPFTIASLRLP